MTEFLASPSQAIFDDPNLNWTRTAKASIGFEAKTVARYIRCSIAVPKAKFETVNFVVNLLPKLNSYTLS